MPFYNQSLEVSGLIEHVITMTAYTLTSEQGREAQTLRDLIFRDELICALGLSDHEFANLDSVSGLTHQ